MNLDHITARPRWSEKKRNLLLCARCDRRIAEAVHPTVESEGYHLMFEPAWAKVINTDGQVWRVSKHALQKEKRQRRAGTIGSRNVYTPAARRDREIDTSPIPPDGLWLICDPDCTLEQKVMPDDITEDHVFFLSEIDRESEG